MQQVALFRAVMDKAYGASNSLSVEKFKGICERYRQNRLCGYGEQIAEDAGKEGAVAKEKLEELYVALKYTQVAGRSIHCAAHPVPHNPPLPKLSHILQSLASKLTQRYRGLPSAFLKFDQDHDGFISFSEFQQGLSDLGLAYSDSQSQEMFTLLDNDRTGLLSLAAFSQLKGDPYFPAIRGRERYASQPAQTLLEPLPVAHKVHVRLPSDHDPRFTYGAPTVFSEDIRDILSNSYEKAYLEAMKRKEERRKVRKGRKAK
jgi:Ca2+-binding EF-hand superfamily protein